MFFELNKLVKKLSVIGLASSTLIVTGTIHAEDFVGSAEKYLASNEVNAAIIELKNAIKYSPQEAKPRLILGEIYLKQGNFVSAEKELSRALQLGTPKEQVVPLLARALIVGGKNEQALDLINETFPSSDSSNTETQAFKVIAELNLGMVEDAKRSFQPVSNAQSKELYARLAEARIAAADSNPDLSLSIINSILDSSTDNSDVWLLKGHIESSLGDYEASVDSYKKAYDLSPAAHQFTLFIARNLVLAQRFEEATSYVDKLLSLYPNLVLTNELKATILYSDKNYADAREYAERAIHNGSDQLPTILISAISAYQLGLYEQAYGRFKQIDSRLPDNHFSKKLYVAVQLKLGYIDNAIESMGNLSLETQEDSLFLSRASMQLAKLGRDEDALELAQKAFSDKNYSGSQLMLGLIQLEGKDKSGVKNIESALKSDSENSKAEIGLAYYYIKSGQLDEANNIAQARLEENPDDVDAIALSGVILQLKGNIEEAEQLFKKVIDTDPGNFQATISMAQIANSKGDWEQTYSLAYSAKKLSPENKISAQMLFISGRQLDKLNEVGELIDQQIESNPKSAILVEHKAQLHVLNQQWDQATNLLETYPDTQKSPNMWKLLGSIYVKQDNWLAAENAYESLVKAAPTDPDAYIKAIIVSEYTRKPRIGIRHADRAAEIFPNDIRFRLMKAGLLVKTGNINTSQKIIDGLDDALKNTPYTLKIQGLIYATQKDYQSAVTVHEKLYEIKPGLKSANELASLYILAGDEQQAVQFLEEVIETYPKQAHALKIKLADIQLQSNPERAIQQYKNIVAKEPKNVIALNNIAALYLEADNIDEACHYAESAYELAKELPPVVDTYGYCLLKQGKTETAIQKLKFAYNNAQDNAEIALHFAESLIQNGQSAEARTVLSKVITDDPRLLISKNELESKLSI
ncbi:PEP-CTERM system TPR-repeat protein PrsT [Vibrio hannami]|uniref:XrtA/PEP-CTERM system TPR-repeat protein PrsT n=1 Tax=Vibrio hannami TaxID=2717094 RepID=UPI00240FD167|nr:XrtA/PEP-CTERM system TPR-repeat protein PrsT [Vibrio hannami]MDG3088291.1 PEP-CTERM system TPR-repeat protein PrsT [Vibrio hannami]